jgi:hypothetical protein
VAEMTNAVEYTRALFSEPETLTFEGEADAGDSVIRIRSQRPFCPRGLHLEGAPRARLLDLRVGTSSFLQGHAGVPAAVFSFAPLPGIASSLECKHCGAVLAFDGASPVLICAYCRAPSIVHFPESLAPDFVRHFCEGLPTFEPSVYVQLFVRNVTGGFFWGDGLRR